MDIFFQDPDEAPLPPEDVRIREFKAMPWQDGGRIRVYLETDPFQKRPCAEITITGEEGKVLAEVEIIETITRKMEFNMHLRMKDTVGMYRIQAVLYYQQYPAAEEAGEDAAASKPERMVVDQAESTFEIPANNALE